MGKLKIWTLEEDNILKESFELFKSKKWKKTSQKLRQNGYNRTDVQCRQRYVNHLDPSVNKQIWILEQLQILYQNYQKHKNKWFLIQQFLPGRTQTKIKNYFYGNIRYLLKIIIKNFLKQPTGFINDVKTNTLLDIYQGKNQFEGYGLIKRTICQMQYKVQMKECVKLIKKNQIQFLNLAKLFLDKYNARVLMNEEDSQYNDQNPVQEINHENQNSKAVKNKVKIEEIQNKHSQIIQNSNLNLPVSKQDALTYQNKGFQLNPFSWQYPFRQINQQYNYLQISSIPMFMNNSFHTFPMFYPPFQ